MKIRTRGPKFREHFNQARLFYNSLSSIEKSHVIDAAAFELGKVDDQIIQVRMIERFLKIDYEFAHRVANALGINVPKEKPEPYNGHTSPALSQLVTVPASIATRRIAFVVADGYDKAQLLELRTAIKSAQAMTFIVGPRRGPIKSRDQLETLKSDQESVALDEEGISADFSFLTSRSTLFDAPVLLGGSQGLDSLPQRGEVIHYINEAYKHYKTVGAVGEAVDFVRKYCAIPDNMLSTDNTVVSNNGVVTVARWSSTAESESIVEHAVEAVKKIGKSSGYSKTFVDAVAQHRHWNRDISDVPA